MVIGLVLDDTLDKNDGVQMSVLTIGAELKLRGHDVHYIVSSTNRNDIENVHSMSGFLSLKFNGNSVRTPKFLSRNKIKQLFSEVSFDVLHIQMPFSPLLAGRIIKYAPPSTKIFGTFHILPYNFFANYGTKLLRVLLKKQLRRFRAFYAVSPPALEFMNTSFGVSGKVVPNPIDHKFYNNVKKNKQLKKQVVFVGRFDKRKGVVQLIEAYSRIPSSIRLSTDFIMCGKGPLLEKMKHLAQSKNVTIHFPGFISDQKKAQYLTNADVAVFPSTGGESFGIVLTEAMSAGAGITLGGDNPGYASVLNRWPEVLFNPNAIEEFSALLIKSLSNDKQLIKIGSEQRVFVKSFDVKIVVDTLLCEYNS